MRIAEVVLLTVSLAISFVGAEFGIRMLKLAPEIYSVPIQRYQLSSNVKIGWEPKPKGDYSGSQDYPPEETNSMGYRDYDHEIQNRAGTYRIIVIGDSIAAGLGVPNYRDTFPSLLEKILKDGGRKVEVINLAVSGYNTQQEVETLIDKGLVFTPDLVVVAYCWNDHGFSAGRILTRLIQEQNDTLGRTPSAALIHVLSKSAMFRLVYYRLLDGIAGLQSELRDDLEMDKVLYYFQMLANLSAANHFNVLVVSFPRFDKLAISVEVDTTLSGEPESLQAGLDYLNLLEPMRACNSGQDISHDSLHPGPIGHRCAAEAIADRVIEFQHSRPILNRQ